MRDFLERGKGEPFRQPCWNREEVSSDPYDSVVEDKRGLKVHLGFVVRNRRTTTPPPAQQSLEEKRCQLGGWVTRTQPRHSYGSHDEHPFPSH